MMTAAGDWEALSESVEQDTRHIDPCLVTMMMIRHTRQTSFEELVVMQGPVHTPGRSSEGSHRLVSGLFRLRLVLRRNPSLVVTGEATPPGAAAVEPAAALAVPPENPSALHATRSSAHGAAGAAGGVLRPRGALVSKRRSQSSSRRSGTLRGKAEVAVTVVRDDAEGSSKK